MKAADTKTIEIEFVPPEDLLHGSRVLLTYTPPGPHGVRVAVNKVEEVAALDYMESALASYRDGKESRWGRGSKAAQAIVVPVSIATEIVRLLKARESLKKAIEEVRA